MKHHFLKSLFKLILPQTLSVIDAGDIVSGAFGNLTISNASVASNGANSTIGGAGVNKIRAPQDMVITRCSWEPVDADQTATQTTSFRRISLLDGGPVATGTVVLGSVNLSVSLASNTTRDLTLLTPTAATVDQGDVLVFSQATVGGTDDDNTELRAGLLHIGYKPI